MSELLRSLALNVASLALFVWLWTRLDDRLRALPRWVRDGAMGAVMGLAGVVSIWASVEVTPGVLFDLRTVPVIAAGYFGGPIGGLLASALTAGYRYGLGGSGAIPAMLGIAFAGLLGMFGNQFRGTTHPAVDVAILSIGAAALPYATAFLTASIVSPPWELLLPLALARGAGTIVALWVVLHEQQQSHEQLVLRSALSQVPDFFYVKDPDLRLVAVNANVAAHHGFKSAKDVLGKTDYDLALSDRADRLAAQERLVMSRVDVPLRDVECVTDRDGQDRWFETVKVAIKGPDGDVLGLVGTTRDVSRHREVEAELKEGRDLLAFLLEEMSVGVALFDRHGFLRYSNARYRSAFPLTAHVRVPGTHIRDILLAVVETGEQLGIEGGPVWAEQVAAQLAEESDQQIPLCDGTWAHIRTRPTVNGAALVIVSDVTTMKGSEKALMQASDQLAKIATIDGVTGVLTRRAFDAKLREEVPRSETAAEPISFLMIDVDHFKLYNDTYGHMAGDVCLGRIGHCLNTSVRAGDYVGRYGGEEFAVLLPGATPQDATAVAERFMGQLAEMAEPHVGSQTGLVTASVGVAIYEAEEFGRTRAELVKRADDALYQSKAKGRNQTTLWQADDGGIIWLAQA